MGSSAQCLRAWRKDRRRESRSPFLFRTARSGSGASTGRWFLNTAPSWRGAPSKKQVVKNSRPASRSEEPQGQSQKTLFHVFPVRRIQPPAENPEHRQEDEHPDTQLHTEILRRFAHPLHVGNEIRDVGVVISCISRARSFHLETLEH